MLKLPIYMDNHATTPLDPRVLEAMLPYFKEDFGNAASRNHAFGWKAEAAVEKARKQVAALIGASEKEIVFTSGATESDNLAIKGVVEFYRSRATTSSRSRPSTRRCSTPASAWSACAPERLDELQAAAALRARRARRHRRRTSAELGEQVRPREGRDVPDAGPRGSPPARGSPTWTWRRTAWSTWRSCAAAITDKTVLVSIMLANNEIGAVQPVDEIGKLCREKGVLFHCDAVQGVGKVPFDVEQMNVDLASHHRAQDVRPQGRGRALRAPQAARAHRAA